jgi:hypothetical protein
MMTNGLLRFVLGLTIVVGVAVAGPGRARADASCSSLVTSMANQLNQHGGAYDFELTIHRTDVWLVTYSAGTLHGTGSFDWPATGTANQLFSDRRSGNQRFNASAADTLTPWISATGQLFIFYNTWNFSTTWDLSCSGSTFTANVPNVGIVSLTLRNWHT